MRGMISQLSDMLLAVVVVLSWFYVHRRLTTATSTERAAVAIVALVAMLSLLGHSMSTSVTPDISLEHITNPIARVSMGLYPIIACAVLLRMSRRAHRNQLNA